MPDYGQTGFGAPGAYGDMYMQNVSTGTSPSGGSTNTIRASALSPQVIEQLAQARLARGAQAAAAATTSPGADHPTPVTMADLQNASPQTLADKWTQSLASIPAELRPFVDDITLNCMGSEGAIANAEDYMHGLIKVKEKAVGVSVGATSSDEYTETLSMLQARLGQFGPAKDQLQKCGELMLALLMAAGRADLSSPTDYDTAIKPLLRYYAFNTATKQIDSVGAATTGGSAAPPSPEDQLSPPQPQQPGSMDPASSAPIEGDTVLFQTSETPTASVPAPLDIPQMEEDVVKGFRSFVKKPWFPYAAGGVGLALILFMRK